MPRLRAVRCFAQYATTLFPDSEVLEFDKRFDVNRYNDQLGTKLVIVDRISTNKQKLKTAFRVSVCLNDAAPVVIYQLHASSALGKASESGACNCLLV